MMYQTLLDTKTFIETELPGEVVSFAALHSITMDPLRFLDIHQNKGQQFPSLSVLPDTTGEQQIGPGNSLGSAMVRRFNRINLVFWHRGNNTDSRRIEDNVTGYMDSLEKIFTDYADMNLPRSYQLVMINDTSYTDIFPDPISKTQHLLLKGAVMNIEVRGRS